MFNSNHNTNYKNTNSNSNIKQEQYPEQKHTDNRVQNQQTIGENAHRAVTFDMICLQSPPSNAHLCFKVDNQLLDSLCIVGTIADWKMTNHVIEYDLCDENAQFHLVGTRWITDKEKEKINSPFGKQRCYICKVYNIIWKSFIYCFFTDSKNCLERI